MNALPFRKVGFAFFAVDVDDEDATDSARRNRDICIGITLPPISDSFFVIAGVLHPVQWDGMFARRFAIVLSAGAFSIWKYAPARENPPTTPNVPKGRLKVLVGCRSHDANSPRMEWCLPRKSQTASDLGELL
jgi:hypothetical protein